MCVSNSTCGSFASLVVMHLLLVPRTHAVRLAAGWDADPEIGEPRHGSYTRKTHQVFLPAEKERESERQSDLNHRTIPECLDAGRRHDRRLQARKVDSHLYSTCCLLVAWTAISLSPYLCHQSLSAVVVVSAPDPLLLVTQSTNYHPSVNYASNFPEYIFLCVSQGRDFHWRVLRSRLEVIWYFDAPSSLLKNKNA